MKEPYIKDIEEIGKNNLLSSSDLYNSIKNLSNPRFLGSIHLKNQNVNPNFSSVDNLLKGQLELKVNKSLKNMMLNPVTKVLILSMIIFNLVWMLFIYFL